MGATESTLPSTTAAERGRDKLARLVVVGSFLTLFLLVGVLIGFGQGKGDAADVAKTAFTAVLPVIAGWVGTVLAFYFSAASQDRTNATLEKAIAQSGGGSGSGPLVSEKMLPMSSIEGVLKFDEPGPQGDTPLTRDTKLSDVQKIFETTLPNGSKISRLIFVEKGVFRYVLHSSTLNAFFVKKSPSKPEDLSVADLLADAPTLEQVSKLVVFVSSAATLADAKQALDKVNGAQDIIVTGSGNATEPMIGWLSNIDLTKAIEVK